MVRCPNCGSIAQPKLIGCTVNPSDWYNHELYQCGCEHKFIHIVETGENKGKKSDI